MSSRRANSRPWSNADVAVLTVIPVELEWVREALAIEPDHKWKSRRGRIYYFGESLVGPYRVVVSCVGEAGTGECAVAAASVIRDYRPRIVILVGIAAGMKGKVKIGNVILSERVWDYEKAALVTAKRGRMAESPRPEVTRLEFAVQQDVTHYLSLPGKELRLTQRLTTIRGAFPEAGPDANQRMRQFFEKHVAIAPDVDTATMASGNMLLKNPRFLYRLQADGHGRIKIGEMEASGLVTACREHNTPWFVIRGVSDLGDERKSDKFHKFAAQMAAIVTRDFIECGLDLQIQRARAPGRLITAKTPTAPSLPEISKAISRLSQNPLADARPSGPVLKKYFDMSTVFRGTVFRLVRAPFVPTSAVSWSARTPWAEDGSVIFFALTPKTALSELGPEVNVLQSKFQIVQFYVNLSHVLRLSDAIVQTRLNIDSAHLLSNVTYAKCVRDTARIARCEGLIVQSKWDPRGYLLIVFDRIRPDSTVSFVATLVCED